MTQCTPVAETRQTHWGHQNVVHEYPTPIGALRGIVVDRSRAILPNVLVEIYDQPEIARTGDQSRTGQRRLAACATDHSGRFSFKFPPGRYEIRASKPEWQTISVLVELRKGTPKKEVEVPMEVSD
jgi:hypothetical protein